MLGKLPACDCRAFTARNLLPHHPSSFSTIGRTLMVAMVAIVCAQAFAWSNDSLVCTPICTATGSQQYPQPVGDGSGGAIIVWRDARGGNSIYAQRVDSSGVVLWPLDGVAIGTGTCRPYSQRLASDGAGGAIVTWSDNRTGTYDIYAQRIDSTGMLRWTANGVAICTAAGDQETPELTGDGTGGAIVTWSDSRSGVRDIYVQRINASGVVQWTTNGVPICTTTGNEFPTRPLGDGSGGATIAWWDGPHICAQRIDATGAVQWAANGVTVCTASTCQQVNMESDGSGGAIMAWEDARSGVVDIYAQRIDASGVTQWSTNGVPICTAPDDQTWPEVISDGLGGVIISWTDLRNKNFDHYAQQVNAGGVVQWAANGVQICSNLDELMEARLISDDSHGAITTWRDPYSAGANIRAQRIDVGGRIQWSPSGAAVCTAPGTQSSPQLIGDGSGGAIIAWVDERSDGENIYAQHVTSGGVNAACSGEWSLFE